MISSVTSLPRLQGALRYSTKRDRFVFGIVDHEQFVAVAVDPRICRDWFLLQKLSYGECSGLISLRRDQIEEEMRSLIRSGGDGVGGRLNLWGHAEMDAAF